MLYKYSKLEALSHKDMEDFKKINISVLGDAATQHICKAIKGDGYTKGINYNIYEAEYNQIQLIMMDPKADLWKQKNDFVFLLMSGEMLYKRFTAIHREDRVFFAENIINEIKSYWKTICRHDSSTKIIQSNFAFINDRVFGDYSNKVQESFLFQARKLNYLLMELISDSKYGNVFILDMESIQSQYGIEQFHDTRTYYVGKLPVSIRLLPIVADRFSQIVLSQRGQVKKCLITDLDNTLWGGVIGDDGLENIQIGELGEGQAFSALQSWIKELKERGIIICVCSKNEENVAKKPFEEHPDMILSLDDITIFVANWEDKASNIKMIQDTLNIGMDGIVFIDDNPFERNLVREAIPDITVPELPEDATEYLSYLQSLNLFETASYSEEDVKRTKQYKAEAGRKLEQGHYDKYDDYLQSLNMKAVIAPFDLFHRPRIAQLTQRSNQFNLRTIRYSEADVEFRENSPDYITMYVTMQDKYGDYGLISVVCLQNQGDILFVEEWLMSCRVLNRGTEELVCDAIFDVAKRLNVSKVVGEYIPTAKNKMVENLYLQMGFTDKTNGIFEANVSEYKTHKVFIEKELRV